MDVPPTPAPSAAAPAMSSRASPEAPPPWRMSLGYMLVLRVLAHPEGVGALSHSGWLDEELTDWVSGPTASTSAAAPRKGGEAGTKCEAYLLGVEARLLEALQQADPDYPSAAFAHAASNANGGVTQTTDTALSHRPSLPLPPHLLGALAATAAGRTALGQRRALRWALTAIEEAAASTPPLASHLLPPPPVANPPNPPNPLDEETLIEDEGADFYADEDDASQRTTDGQENDGQENVDSQRNVDAGNVDAGNETCMYGDDDNDEPMAEPYHGSAYY